MVSLDAIFLLHRCKSGTQETLGEWRVEATQWVIWKQEVIKIFVTIMLYTAYVVY